MKGFFAESHTNRYTNRVFPVILALVANRVSRCGTRSTPGGARTPNLLIRSQEPVSDRRRPSTTLRGERRPSRFEKQKHPHPKTERRLHESLHEFVRHLFHADQRAWT